MSSCHASIVIAATLEEVAEAESRRTATDEKISAARMACAAAQKALGDVPPRAVTREQRTRVRTARRACNAAARAVSKALRGGDEDQELRRSLIISVWSGLNVELLIRESERQLAEIEGTAFPALRVVA